MKRMSLPVLVIIFFSLAPRVDAQVRERSANYRDHNAGGYQLKYTPIPPKPKTEKELTPEQRPVVKIDYGPPLSPEQLAEKAAEHDARAADNAKLAADWRAARDAWNAQYNGQQQAAYNAWAQQQQKLANIYDAAYARAQAQADVQRQQALIYPTQPTQLIVRPYDMMQDYFGVYIPGRMEKKSTVVTVVPSN
jgi:hypothetical protein